VPNKKTVAVIVGTIIGILIGIYAADSRAEIIVILSCLILVPFLVIDARFGIIGQEVIWLGFGALVGAVIGTMRGESVLNSISGAVIGTGLTAVILPILRAFGLEKHF
jgi:hypothetical protein